MKPLKLSEARRSPREFAPNFTPRGPALSPAPRLLRFSRTPGAIFSDLRKKKPTRLAYATTNDVWSVPARPHETMIGHLPGVVLVPTIHVQLTRSPTVRFG